MSPEDVSWWFGTVFHQTGQIDGAAHVHVDLRSAQNGRLWLCNHQIELVKLYLHA